ncbi:unnamed protein product [Rhodiola kirilowii]
MLSIRDYEKMNFGMKGLIVQTINLRNYLVPLGNCLNMSDFKVGEIINRFEKKGFTLKCEV